MEYQKIANLLNDESNKPSKFRTRNWIEINDEARGTYSHNKQIDNAEYIDIVMPMYNLIEYSDNYSKTSGSLWQYCKDIPAINDNGDIFNFDGNKATDSFSFKAKITGQTNDDVEINGVEILVPLKCLSNFWRTLEMPLISCEIELILTWSKSAVIISTGGANQIPTFKIKRQIFMFQ